tara:strand:+ start:279 stop:494 length:216 start_codon:yes stop_codon:yes gene_type:complete
MAWKVKKEYQGKTVPNFRIPLDDLNQKTIKGLSESVRNGYFEQDTPKPKKKKKEVKIEEVKIEDSYNEYTD